MVACQSSGGVSHSEIMRECAQDDVRILCGQARVRRCLNVLNDSIGKFQIQTVADLRDGFGIRFR
jgi:hypothetical protein